jgi:hypothetical protein
MRDLYWCAVLKFMCTLFLATPTESVMVGMLGILEPMCSKEEVLEIGTSMEESDERDAIYGHHRETESTLATANAAATAVVAPAAVTAGDAPISINTDPYDVLTHFLAN